MSGGIGPTSDIALPEEKPAAVQQRRRPFPSLWHLKCIAIITVLAASGLVTLLDLSVVLFSTFYLLLLSAYSFPPPPSSSSSAAAPAPFFPNNRILPVYVTFAGFAGLLLPICYILAGIYAGDKQSVAAAAPHLFLLSSQVVMEGVTASFRSRFSTPVFAFVPVFYNSWRMPAVAEWARWEVMTSASERVGAPWMVYAGRALALLNLGLWSFNLFGFLLPVYLPRALKRYYSKVE